MPDDSLHVMPSPPLTGTQHELASEYRERLPLLEGLRKNLQEKTENALGSVSHIDRITFRVKDADSFARKALPEDKKPPYERPLIEVEDQVAGRVLVLFIHDMEIVRNKLKEWFKGMVEETRRRPPKSSEFGYESDHFVLVIDEHMKPQGWQSRRDMPVTFELQIRTLFMHSWAEPQHELGYKGGDLSEDERRLHAWIAASAWGADRAFNEAWEMAQNHNS